MSVSFSLEQQKQLRQLLVTLKNEAEHSLSTNKHFGLEEEMIDESMGELSNYDNHPADHGTLLYEREKDIALNEHAERQLSEVNAALERLENGQFGYCDVCKQPIPYERLKVQPTAIHCVEHSTDQALSKARPIEEEVLEPPFETFTGTQNENNTSFDSEDTWQAVARWGTSDTPSDFFSNKKADYNDMYYNADERIGLVESIEDVSEQEEE